MQTGRQAGRQVDAASQPMRERYSSLQNSIYYSMRLGKSVSTPPQYLSSFPSVTLETVLVLLSQEIGTGKKDRKSEELLTQVWRRWDATPSAEHQTSMLLM